jgi:hypothetical protein
MRDRVSVAENERQIRMDTSLDEKLTAAPCVHRSIRRSRTSLRGFENSYSIGGTKMNEEHQEPGFVKKKIRNSNPKNRGVESRTRASRLIAKAKKKLAEIPDEFLDRALKRLGQQLNATKKIWDPSVKELIDIPDEKIRFDAAVMILAYKWGKPVERSISAHADFEDLGSLLQAMKDSPASQASLQKTVEGKAIEPTLPEPQREEH